MPEGIMNNETETIYHAIDAGLFETSGMCKDTDFTLSNETENSFDIDFCSNYNIQGKFRVTVEPVD